MSATMRSTRLVVLPVPAAASTRIVVPRSSRMAFRAASSDNRGSLLFDIQLPERDEHGIRSVDELRLGELARRTRTTADRLEGAVTAIALVDGVREHPRRDQIEQAGQDIAGRLPVGSRRDPLALPLPAGEEIAGGRDPAGPARPGEEGFERQGVKNRLNLAPAAQRA